MNEGEDMVMVGHNQIRDNPSCWGDTNTLPDPHLSRPSSLWSWICGQYRNFYIYSTSPQVESVCDFTMNFIYFTTDNKDIDKFALLWGEAQLCCLPYVYMFAHQINNQL